MITYQTGNKTRNWGGWYQITQVLLDGVNIGQICTKRNNGRITTNTSVGGWGVMGSDVAWLIRQHNQNS